MGVENQSFPLVSYLNLEKEGLETIKTSLKNAEHQLAQHAKKLGAASSDSSLSKIKQLSEISTQRAAINSVLDANFKKTGDFLARYQGIAVAAAQQNAGEYERLLTGLVLTPQEQASLGAGLAKQATTGIDALVTRVTSSAKPLSGRVYDAAEGAKTLVNNQINRGLAMGLTARQMADSVSYLINPNTPGGVSYAAMRLARTEINNAFHAGSIKRYKDSGIVDSVDWNLSGSHPEGDECDAIAHDGPYDIDKVPAKPHPQCFCYVTPHLPEPDEFLENLFAGKYDDGPVGQSYDASKFADAGSDAAKKVKEQELLAAKKAETAAKSAATKAANKAKQQLIAAQQKEVLAQVAQEAAEAEAAAATQAAASAAAEQKVVGNTLKKTLGTPQQLAKELGSDFDAAMYEALKDDESRALFQKMLHSKNNLEFEAQDVAEYKYTVYQNSAYGEYASPAVKQQIDDLKAMLEDEPDPPWWSASEKVGSPKVSSSVPKADKTVAAPPATEKAPSKFSEATYSKMQGNVFAQQKYKAFVDTYSKNGISKTDWDTWVKSKTGGFAKKPPTSVQVDKIVKTGQKIDELMAKGAQAAKKAEATTPKVVKTTQKAAQAKVKVKEAVKATRDAGKVVDEAAEAVAKNPLYKEPAKGSTWKRDGFPPAEWDKVDGMTGTPAELRAAGSYTGSGYREMNNIARSISAGGEPAGIDRVNSFQNGLMKNKTPVDFSVSRGSNFGGVWQKDILDNAENLVGKTYTSDMFLSTSAKTVGGKPASTAFQASADVLFDIHVPAGSPGGWMKGISAFGGSEAEFVLPVGSKLHIVDVTYKEIDYYGGIKRTPVLKMVLTGVE